MDLFREMFHGRPQPLAQSRVCEERVVSARNAMIRHLMRAEVPHVISDDTNLHPSAPSLFAAFAREFGYQGVAKDFTHVPLDECISRDRLRSRQVGEIVIRRMHERYFEPGRRECR
jgi:predicted kinase